MEAKKGIPCVNVGSLIGNGRHLVEFFRDGVHLICSVKLRKYVFLTGINF